MVCWNRWKDEKGSVGPSSCFARRDSTILTFDQPDRCGRSTGIRPWLAEEVRRDHAAGRSRPRGPRHPRCELRVAPSCSIILRSAPLRVGFLPTSRAVANVHLQTLLREQLINLQVFLHASNYWQYIVRSDRRRKGLANPNDADWDEDDAKRDADEGSFFPSPSVAAAAAAAAAAV
jgi:hypothetical protein